MLACLQSLKKLFVCSSEMENSRKATKRKNNIDGVDTKKYTKQKRIKTEPDDKTDVKFETAKTVCEIEETGICDDDAYFEPQGDEDLPSSWNEAEFLSHRERVPIDLAQNFIGLLKEGCTLPFIARYRKLAVKNLMPDRLQELHECYQNICQLKKKVKTALANLKTSKKLTPDVEKSILNARNLNELELIYSPLKSNKQTLAEKARKLGLEPIAIKALNGDHINLNSFCKKDEELSTVEKVEVHMTHIVADIIYKDTRVLEEMRSRKEQCRFTLQSTLNKTCLKNKNKEEEHKRIDSKSDPETYKLYFDWKCPTQFVKAHQTLAVNRAEDEKILTVKVVIPDWYYNGLERFCTSQWKSSFWVKKGLEDAYKRLIKPWITRQVRSDLTSAAQKEAVKTFTSNLEKYLLTEPIKNRRIAGLDPGFKHGCKVGVIDKDGQALEVLTLYPDLRRHNKNDSAARQLKEVIHKHNVELISLGNGTASRETETWLNQHDISANTPVVIVPEQGASIYSVSKEARKEHSNMDPNLISALSIARRVLDPLGELIKVDPKNLGVGMYQHDIPPKMLDAALGATVENIVSLVGVDLNTASLALLRRISGLNENRAKKIIDYRTAKGGFKKREDILKVTGIGKTTYEQCAGFLKVIGGSEHLDATIIHPESYSVAKNFAKKLGVDIKDLDKPDFPTTVEQKIVTLDIEKLIKELKTDQCSIDIIINAFKQKRYEDNMITFSKPVYTLAVKELGELREGMQLTGVVNNVVPFGCFVSYGAGHDGLVHSSRLGGRSPRLGDRVKVTVVGPVQPNRVQLQLDEIL